ncbi:hypothetical protein [Lysobacter gummosus]
MPTPSRTRRPAWGPAFEATQATRRRAKALSKGACLRRRRTNPGPRGPG